MADLSYTPGPWALHEAEYPDAGGYIPPQVFSEADPDTPEFICTMAVRDGITETANGLLVAAAPELLDGCNALLGLVQLISSRADLSEDIKLILLESHRTKEAIDAVAKAEGRPNG